MTSQEPQGEAVDVEHILDYYQKELTEKTRALAVASAQIKSRDVEIARLRKLLDEKSGT